MYFILKEEREKKKNLKIDIVKRYLRLNDGV